MGAPSEEVVYSLAITITLCTPAPLCPPRRPALFVVPPVSPFSFSSGLAILSFLLSQSFLITSSPCRSLPLGTPIILSHRPRLFRNCFRPFLLLLRLPLAGEFRVPSVTTYFTGVFILLSFSFAFLSFVFFIVHPSLLPAVWHPRLASISRAVAPSSGLSRFLPPSTLPFILEMGIGIHETKLMITTSKQRAERPTATCRVIYKSSFSSYIPLSSLTDPTRLLIRFLFLSLSFPLFLRSIFSFSEMSSISIVS